VTGFAVTAGVGFVVAGLFAGVFVLFSGFAQSLESLSVLRRKALLEADPARFGTLLAPEHVRVPVAFQGLALTRIGAMRKGAPGAVEMDGKPLPPLGYDHLRR